MSRVLSLNIASAVRSRGDLLFATSMIFSLLIVSFLLLNSYTENSKTEIQIDTTFKVPDMVNFRNDYFVDASVEQPFLHRMDEFNDELLDRFILGRSFFSVP